MWCICQCYERDVQENTSNYEKSTYSKTKIPENYDRYWWWVVYGIIAKGLPPSKRSKISKKAQEKQDEIKKSYMKLISGEISGNSNYIGTSLNRVYPFCSDILDSPIQACFSKIGSSNHSTTY